MLSRVSLGFVVFVIQTCFPNETGPLSMQGFAGPTHNAAIAEDA